MIERVMISEIGKVDKHEESQSLSLAKVHKIVKIYEHYRDPIADVKIL